MLKKTSLKITLVFLIYILIILITNGAIYSWLFSDILFGEEIKEGTIRKLPFGRAYVFAHGRYHAEFDNITLSYLEHVTDINNKTIPTKDLIENLIDEGFAYIWLSQCDTGNSKYIKANFTSSEKWYWDDYKEVSRNTKRGSTTPIFLGFGFVRVNLEGKS